MTEWKAFRKRRRLKQKDVAALAQISLKHYNHIEQGKAKPSEMVEARLREVLGVPTVPSRLIPVLNTAACGVWQDFTDLDYPPGVADQYELAVTRDPNAFFVVADGNSMIGTDGDLQIRSGTYLLVTPNAEVRNGDIVLAKTEKGVTVKKFHRMPEGVILQPLNPEYPPLVVRNGPDLRVYRVSQVMMKL